MHRLAIALVLLPTLALAAEDHCEQRLAAFRAARVSVLECLDRGDSCDAELEAASAAATASAECVDTSEPVPIATATPSPVATSTPASEPRAEPVKRSGPVFDTTAFAGAKRLADSEWAPVASHVETGLSTTFGGSRWPILLAADVFHSIDQGTANDVKVRASTTELCAGFRHVFATSGRFRPHLGAGVALMMMANRADDGTRVESISGSGAGSWVDGGVRVDVGRASLGVQMRYSSGSVRINDRSISTAGLHVGATVGFGIGRNR